MNKARFYDLKTMLASVLSSGRGIICGRAVADNMEMLEGCVKEALKDFEESSGTAYIGFTYQGVPFYTTNADLWRALAGDAECVFQMHVDHERGIYDAILMR